MPTKSELSDTLRDQGFDESIANDGSVDVRCSQCEALVISGVACHETGCQNQAPSEYDDYGDDD